MELKERIEMLYAKDSSEAYTNLKQLSLLSESENILYCYFNDFFNMLTNDKYGIRIRGFVLLCKQAKWDKENKIDKVIDNVLAAIDDEKPTAVRMKLQAMQDIIDFKPELHDVIKTKLISIDPLLFKETMQSLISKDIKALLAMIN